MFNIVNPDAFILYDTSNLPNGKMYSIKYIRPTDKDNRYHLRVNMLKDNRFRYIITISSKKIEDILKSVTSMPILTSWFDTSIVEKCRGVDVYSVGNDTRYIIKNFWILCNLLVNIENYFLDERPISEDCVIYMSKCKYKSGGKNKLYTKYYNTTDRKWYDIKKRWYKENPFTRSDLTINDTVSVLTKSMVIISPIKEHIE